MKKQKLATAWLDGCSGCHMSFLDLDDRLLELAERVEFVYSPLVDLKEFPAEVDITLLEGAVATDADLAKLRRIRSATRLLVALGDCAITGNLPAMRNPVGLDAVLLTTCHEHATLQPQEPSLNLPHLLPRVRPIQEFVLVDHYLPGCPPSAEDIFSTLTALLDATPLPEHALSHFGA